MRGKLLAMLFLMPQLAGSLDAAEPPRFERDVQPIFSKHCLKCHGMATRRGGLGLSDREAGLAELDSGARAIVPGDIEASELLVRVMSTDPGERMPPQGEPLSAAEIDVLKRWIAAGAEWPGHWAYRPLQPVAVPAAVSQPQAGWARTPIDLFILQALQERGLEPSPMADKRTWLRRVTFDLWGLPPTPEDQARFLADESAEAYERVADRLLAGPQYGERWARHWMDVVHYAETHGHDQDRPRPNAWPYRDYLIQSLNADKPYGRFVAEQVAGDVLFPADPQAIAATGFLATGPWDESSLQSIQENSIDREIGRYLDRDDIVTTVMSTFASSTVHCARCHDHKFDPISQAEYYSLQAVFSGIEKAERPFEPDLQLVATRRELQARKDRLPAQRATLDPLLLEAGLQAEIAGWEQRVAAAAAAWTVLTPETFTSEHGATLTLQPDGSVLSGGTLPEKDTTTLVASTTLQGISGIRLEVLTDPSLSQQGPGRQANGNLHLSEFKLAAKGQGAAGEPTNVPLQNPRADFDQGGWTIAHALDGNAGTAWGIYPEVGKPHRAVFELREPLSITGGAQFTVRLEQLHGGGHLIGRARLSVTNIQPLPLSSETLPPEIAAILSMASAERSDTQRAAVAAYYLADKLDKELAALPPPQMLYCGSGARPPRKIHVLHRGDVQQPRDEAQPGALACVSGLEATFSLPDIMNEGTRRAALAKWLAAPENVLTWRSIVNRVWHYHFGRGLVDTPNDFGRMGSTPTHPELLDYLALQFLQSGGSLKQLHRQIVTSAVYRQSSAHRPEFAAVDSDNRLLWRMNRTRLDAECIRDAVLQLTGRLDAQMGGPSVKQFIQTPGIHVTPMVDYKNFDVDDPANNRRSVYRFIFRTLPDPFMDSLDCADSSQLTPARNVSVTALQALAMLNNRFIIRQSELLAERAAVASADPAAQVEWLFAQALGRSPTGAQRALFVDYVQQHGLANACRVLLNSNEFMFVN